MTHHVSSDARRFAVQPLVLLLLPLLLSFVLAQAFEPTCPENFSGYLSGPACESYYVCDNGLVVSPVTQCMHGTIFNEWLNVCDFADNFVCGSTRPPTKRPTKNPTVSPTAKLMPTTPHPTFPPQTRSPSSNAGVEDALEFARRDMDRKLFIYQQNWGEWLPSTQYRYDGFIRGLRLMYLEGVGDLSFYLGEDLPGEEGTKVGLVNIAAFLAQSMKETIKYDACDENSWDIIDGMYPLSNACGQLEQSYQDYVCPEGQEHMQCDVDPDMEQKATTQANWYGAPGPLVCGPKSKYPFTGYWDYNFMCDFPWKDPPELCTDYPGQKGGRAVNDEPVPNANGRTDVEGCCWWGRGVIQTTGVCNFGILNYYLGKRAADEGRDSRYPHIDFCKDPGAVCSAEDHPELKWIAGMFYWIRSLQTYDDGWNYLDNLRAFVRSGMQGNLFIDAVSGIVNRGCHNPPCGTGPLDGGYERQENFKKILKVLFEPDGSPRKFREPDAETEFPTAATVPRPADPLMGPPRPEPWSTPPPVVSSDYVNDAASVNDEWIELPNDRVDLVEEEEDWSEVGAADDGSEGAEGEDWSEPEEGGTSSMNLWCGKTQYEAFDNCGRNGYDCSDGVCFNGLQCFMTDGCDNEVDAPEPTPKPTAPVPKESPVNIATAPVKAEVNNIGLRNNYCAKSMAALETDCVMATTCSAGEDCPAGLYCWGDHLCGGSTVEPPAPASNNALAPPTYMPTYDTYMPTTPLIPAQPPAPGAAGQPDEQQPEPSDTSIQFDITDTFFCGTDRAMASTSCHKRCRSGSHEECEGGETCFGYTSCESEIPREPAAELESTGKPIEPPEASKPNPAPTPRPTPAPTPKPSVESEASESVATAGPQLLCASDMSKLEESCTSAQSCAGGPCPSGQFCFPFTCTSSAVAQEEPPIDEKPAPVDNQQPVPAENQQPAPVDNQQPVPAKNQQPAPAGKPQQFHELCPESTSSFTGWHTTANCKEYYECDEGSPGVIHVCGESLLFDKVRNECRPEETVNNYCYGPPANPGLNTAKAMCKEGYTGWEARLGCREYYYCYDGVADVVYACGEDLLFDRQMELCNFAYLVHCVDKGGPATPPPAPPPTPRPTPWPTVRQTYPPTISESPSSVEDRVGSNGGVVGGYSWSETANPTPSPGQSEMPPWLMLMTKNSGFGRVSLPALQIAGVTLFLLW